MKMSMRNTMSRLERGFTDPESSVHLKLSISAFKNVQIRVDGVRPLNKECKLQGLHSYAHASECRH